MHERKRTRTRVMIQTEAFRLFAEQGYTATTVEQIATAADISPRTFFRYFATKEDVVLWDEYDPLVVDMFLARPEDETPFESMRAVILEALHGLYERDRKGLLTRLELFGTVPELRASFLEMQASGADDVLRLYAKHRGRQSARGDLELRVLVGAMNAAVNVALERWQRRGGRGDPSALVDEALGALVSATTKSVDSRTA